jgi:hypothetical protein
MGCIATTRATCMQISTIGELGGSAGGSIHSQPGGLVTICVPGKTIPRKGFFSKQV